MSIVSEAELCRLALASGLARSEAVVLAHLAFFEQLKGGCEIGGKVWRYRTMNEIKAGSGYGVRTINRAISILTKAHLIEHRQMWDPRYPGRKVNGYRLLEAATAILEASYDDRPSRRSRTGRHDVSDQVTASFSVGPDGHHRSGQNGMTMSNKQDIETGSELITLPAQMHHGESALENINLRGFGVDDVYVWFESYLKARKQEKRAHTVALAFWGGLACALREIRGVEIEPFNKVVGERVDTFLTACPVEALGDHAAVSPCIFALWAALNPDAFNNAIEQETGSRPRTQAVSSYQLSRYGFVAINAVQARFDLAMEDQSKDSVLDWLKADF